MYYDIMSSQITKLVLVPLEKWKRLNKNGVGGDTYTTIEIPSSKPRNQEGRGKRPRRKRRTKSSSSSYFSSSRFGDDEELGGAPLPPPSPPLLLQKGKKGKGRGGGRRRKGGIEIIRNVGNRSPGKRVFDEKKKKYVYFKYYLT